MGGYVLKKFFRILWTCIIRQDYIEKKCIRGIIREVKQSGCKTELTKSNLSGTTYLLKIGLRHKPEPS